MTPTSVNVTEGGAPAGFSVVLQSQPANNVTISVSPGSQCTVSAASLTFTPANWDDAQTVTVTAVEDAVVEGDHTCQVGTAAASSDPVYNNIAADDVTANITDNDTAAPTLTVTKTASVIQFSEGDDITFTITVTNDGNVPLTNVTLRDPMIQPQCDLNIGDLDKGTSYDCTGIYRATAQDAALGQIENTATADSNETGPASGSVTVFGPEQPACPPQGTSPATLSAQRIGVSSETASVEPGVQPQAVDPNFPCDVDDEIVRNDMKSLSHNFMAQRLNMLASNGPRLAWRNNRVGGFGDDSNGFNVAGDGGNITGDFAFSSDKVRKALSGDRVMPTADAPANEAGPVNVWIEGNFAFYEDEREDEDARGDFFVGYAGVDLAVYERVNIGIMGAIDWMREDGEDDGRVSGTGWMVGPYISAQIADGLFLDARAMRGWSNNSIRQISTEVRSDVTISSEHEGDFDTDRWLAEATLTGNYDIDSVTLTPDIRFLYLREDQQDYTVECVCKNTDVDGQTVQLAQLSSGLRLSKLIEMNDTLFRPYAAGRLFWNIDNPGELTVDGEYVSTDEFRGALTIGFDANSERMQFGAEATYDGFFVDDYAIGGKLSLGYRF